MNENQDHSNPEHGRPDGVPNEVPITINTINFKVARGRHTVKDLKALGGVPERHEMEQLIAGKLTPLPDDGQVIIHGGEVFVSHPRDGEAS